MNKSKPRLALLGMGVLGGGPLGEGIPVLTDLFSRLSAHYDIVFYSYNSIDARRVPAEIGVRKAVSWRLPGRLKYLFVSLMFGWDNLLHPYDLIFCVSVYPTGRWAIILGKLFKIPVLVQLISLEAVALVDIGYGNLSEPWLRKITHKVCEKADELVAVAEYQKKIAITSLPTSREIAVLPLRVDCKKFQFHKHHLSFPIQFIHIAHFGPIKDQETLFAAFAKVAKVIDCHLRLIGNGFNVPEVHRTLNELKIADKVTIVGNVMHDEIPKYFESAHILLHTSRFETGCAVIQEAMASGVAVCGTEVGILADIGDRYAYIVPPRNSGKLAEKILRLVDDPEAYQRITTEAFQWISTYDAVWSYKNYQLFIDKMLSKTR